MVGCSLFSNSRTHLPFPGSTLLSMFSGNRRLISYWPVLTVLTYPTHMWTPNLLDVLHSTSFILFPPCPILQFPPAPFIFQSNKNTEIWDKHLGVTAAVETTPEQEMIMRGLPPKLFKFPQPSKLSGISQDCLQGTRHPFPMLGPLLSLKPSSTSSYKPSLSQAA